MRISRCQAGGFSLVEVILAVGIFAVAISAIVALLAPLTRQASVSADTLAALRLPDAIRAELRRLAETGGFDALAAQAKPMAAPLPATLTLVASREATRLQSPSYLPPPAADQLAPSDQYFLIEVWTFNQTPLAFDPNGAVLALHIRVSWPYHTPAAVAITPATEREEITCSLSLNR